MADTRIPMVVWHHNPSTLKMMRQRNTVYTMQTIPYHVYGELFPLVAVIPIEGNDNRYLCHWICRHGPRDTNAIVAPIIPGPVSIDRMLTLLQHYVSRDTSDHQLRRLDKFMKTAFCNQLELFPDIDDDSAAQKALTEVLIQDPCAMPTLNTDSHTTKPPLTNEIIVACGRDFLRQLFAYGLWRTVRVVLYIDSPIAEAASTFYDLLDIAVNTGNIGAILQLKALLAKDCVQYAGQQRIHNRLAEPVARENEEKPILLSQRIALMTAQRSALDPSDVYEILLPHGLKIVGASPNPILALARAGHLRACQLIVKHDYDALTARDPYTSQTAIHMACESGNVSLVQWFADQLLSKQEKEQNSLRHSDPKYRFSLEVLTTADSKQTLLHAAARGGSVPVIEWLLRKGFSIRHKDWKGRVPLLVAAKNGHFLIWHHLAPNTAALACWSGGKHNRTFEYYLRARGLSLSDFQS